MPINKELPSIDMKFEKSRKTQDYTIILERENRKKYVLSKYEPRQSVSQFIEKSSINKETLWIVVGYQLGYIIDEINQLCKRTDNVIIIEPQEEHLKLQYDLIEEIGTSQYKDITIFSGNDWEKLRDLYESKCSVDNYYNLYFIVPPAYKEMFSEYCYQLIDVLAKVREKKIIGYNTINHLAKCTLENLYENARFIQKSYDIRQHKDKYNNVPALVVSAGPSLEKNIEHIKDFKGIIFSGGRTIKTIEEHGARPDFMCNIDPSPIIYDTFMGRAESDIPLISIAASYPKVVSAGKGPQYFVETGESLLLQLFNADIQKIETGGSVATLCLSAAYYMGCNPIIFIGQDLAYTDMKTHADNCNPLEQKVSKEKLKSYYSIKGYNEESVLADGTFILFREWIERYINSHNDRVYINSTEGGAKIHGTLQKEFKEVIEEYGYIQKPTINHLPKDDVWFDIQASQERYLLKLQELEEITRKGIRLSEELKKEYYIYKGIRNEKVNRLLYRLEKEVDSELIKISTEGPIGMLFSSKYERYRVNKSYQEPLNETPNQKGIRLSNASINMYQKMQETIEEMRDIIKRVGK